MPSAAWCPSGCAPPLVEAMPADGFRTWMKSHGKLGAQHKVPRVIDDQRLLADLRDLAARERAG